MSEFIRIEIDFQKCVGTKECGGCLKVCPVNIFEEESYNPSIIHKNQDECILCDLCLEACNPDAIAIKKLYENNL